MRTTSDTRGHSYWDLLPNETELTGQINVSITLPFEKRGFHLHKKKYDVWLCLKGILFVVLYDEKENQFWDKTLYKYDRYVIIPGIWHAYQNIDTQNSVLLYYETEKSGADRSDDFEMPLDKYKGWYRGKML